MQAAPIDPRILHEAADWLVQLHGGEPSEAERAACAQWRGRSPEHARAWERAEALMNKLGQLPATLAMPALDRPAGAARSATRPVTRRKAAKLAALLLLAPTGWGAWHVSREQQWGADHRTARGERKELRLADGSLVTLNAASAIDVRFDAQERLIELRKGEILVQTAPDASGAHRPFRVGSAEGRVEALGTRFSVRQDDDRTHVALLQGRLRIEPRRAEPVLLEAGQQLWFTARGVAPAALADESQVAWTQGMLVADKMRLADFVAEISRYRNGIVQCDPEIADLRVSGAYPLDDSERSLRMLVTTYPVRALSRFSGYWVTLAAR